ncbi:MAG: type IV pilus secretin PilQ [Desulfobacterales bacterium]
MDNNRRLMKFILIYSFLLMVAWLGGCSDKKDLKDVQDPFYEQWRVKAEESKGNSPVEPPPIDEEPFEIVSQDPAAEETLEAPRPLPNRKISMKMNNIDVAVLLRALARAANQNIILNEKVTGKININIHEAPWDEVFLGILQTHGLSYAWQGKIIRIMTTEDMDADLLAKARKRELRLSQPPLTRIVAVKFADAEKLKLNLERFVSADRSGEPTGSILVDEHTNSLIVQAVKNDMDKILAVVKKLDRPTPQILIEAYIVEANKDVARELGIQWGGAYKGTSGDKNVIISGNQNSTATGDIGEAVPANTGAVVDLPALAIGSFNPSTLGLIYTRVGEYLLSAQLSALQDQGKLHILSSPSITTQDNRIAFIESGEDIPYQTVEDGEVNVTYREAVLRLEVTPNVIDADTLKLDIKVKKEEADFTRTVLGNPTIITKKAETNVIQNDGQTIVIGGLSQETERRLQTGTPFLEDIPGLGYLFKRKSSADELEELLIFITPHILKSKATR